MSSSDPWDLIIKKIEHETALVTFDNKVKVFDGDNRELYQVDFDTAVVKDTVGAGDTFNVWLYDAFLKSGQLTRDEILYATRKAQEKVGRVGIFL
jgi:sugar/nucleoside kinase (ribokinase family)